METAIIVSGTIALTLNLVVSLTALYFSWRGQAGLLELVTIVRQTRKR